MIDEVVFDYDNDRLSGRKALKMAARLTAFAVCKALRLRPPKDFADLCDNYAERLVKLNKMRGIKTIIGVRDTLSKAELIARLRLIDPAIDVRDHVHIGGNRDPDRQRIWLPSLDQSRLTWHFEDQYCSLGRAALRKTDRPVFHFDNPEHLENYIDFLFCRFKETDADIERVD